MGALLYRTGIDKLSPSQKSFFELEIIDINGQKISFQEFKGKKAYICVNVACTCYLATSNYKELVELYNNYQSQGLEILGFPCNQFMQKESKPESEIKEFVKAKFNASFPLFQKINVNGPNTHEVYKYLRLNSEFMVSENEAREVPWNFGKFLLDKNGKVVKFYKPGVRPNEMKAEIERLLHS